MDAAFNDIKALVSVAAKGSDPVGCVACCMLLSRLPSEVRDQVLLQCGTNLDPIQVVNSAKTVLSNSTVSSTPGQCYLSAATNEFPRSSRITSSRAPHHHFASQQISVPMQSRALTCWCCGRKGHIARDCPKRLESGNDNGGLGAPQVSPKEQK